MLIISIDYIFIVEIIKLPIKIVDLAVYGEENDFGVKIVQNIKGNMVCSSLCFAGMNYFLLNNQNSPEETEA